jgi:hypothetical protein
MLKIVTHDSLKGRLNQLLYWLFLVIEQMLDQLVPGGEILALSLVHPLRWRSEDPDATVSMKSLVSDLAGSEGGTLRRDASERGKRELGPVLEIREGRFAPLSDVERDQAVPVTQASRQ